MWHRSGVRLQDDDGLGLASGDALQVAQEVGRPLPGQHLQVLLVAQRPRHRRIHCLHHPKSGPSITARDEAAIHR